MMTPASGNCPFIPFKRRSTFSLHLPSDVVSWKTVPQPSLVHPPPPPTSVVPYRFPAGSKIRPGGPVPSEPPLKLYSTLYFLAAHAPGTRAAMMKARRVAHKLRKLILGFINF